MTARPPNYGATGPASPFSTTSSSPSAINTTTSSIAFRADINAAEPLTLVPAGGKMIEAYVQSKYEGGSPKAALFFDDHLHYEIEMLSLAVIDIQTLSADVIARAAQDSRLTFSYSVNRAIEQVCLHARNLAEFLAGNTKAQEFSPKIFTDGQFKNLKFGGLKEDLHGKLSGQISHVGRQRTSDETEKISARACVEIASTIFDGIHEFDKCLKDEFRPLWRCKIVANSNPKIVVEPRLGL